MADENNPASGKSHTHQTQQETRTLTVTVSRDGKVSSTSALKEDTDNNSQANQKNATGSVQQKPKTISLDEKRIQLYEEQQKCVANNKKRSAFPIELSRDNFLELKRFEVAKSLDKRGISEMDKLYVGFDHLYVVDDLINDIVTDMPPQDIHGWVIYSAGKNHLNLPQISSSTPAEDIQKLAKFESICAYVLLHFGVTSYTNDRAFFVGSIAGYLFASYFCAHLKISYSVTSLQANMLKGYDFVVPDVVSNTRQVQALSLITKKKIYQLAVFCAQVSSWRVNKAIEKMLIADVNDFDKKTEQEVLANLLRYGG